MPLEKKSSLIALGICAIAFLIWGWILTARYYTFSYWPSWDLPLYGQLMWSLCHGTTETSLFGGSFLIDHANYIAFLLVPFYFFFQSALTLLFFKLIAFFAGAYILFLIARQKLGGPWAILLLLGYIFYPTNMAMLFFEFNFENLAIPVILLAFYFLEAKKLWGFIISCLLLCLIKENMPLTAVMLAGYALIRYWKEFPAIRRWAPIAILAGIAIFYIEVFVIQPALTKGLSFHGSNYWEFYKGIAKTPGDILKTFFVNPGKIIHVIATQKNMLFLAELFGPLLIPALMSPLILILTLPLLLQVLLSSASQPQSIFYYSSSTITVFIFVATIASLARTTPQQRQRLTIILVGAIFFFTYSYLPKWKIRLPRQAQEITDIRNYMLSRVPPDAGVIASYNFLPHLSQRKDLYVFTRSKVSFTRKKEHIPDSVTYALIDFTAHFGNKETAKKLLTTGNWHIDTALEEVVLLRRNLPNGHPLIKISPSTPTTIAPVAHIAPWVELSAITIPPRIKSGAKVLPVHFTWRSQVDLKKGGKVTLSILKDKRTILTKTRAIAYGLKLNKSERIDEFFQYLTPPLSPGHYEVTIILFKDTPPLWKWSQTVTIPFEVIGDQ